MNLRLSLFLLLLPLSSFAQNQTNLAPTQTEYIIDEAPFSLLKLPSEISYRTLRSLGLDQWSKDIKDTKVIKLLNNHQETRVPIPSGTFPFENYEVDFSHIVKREYGFCSGFATLQRNFNLLMHFDPKNVHGQVVPSKKDTKAYYDFYFKLIKEAYNLKPVIIPGKKDLNQLMSDKVIQDYTKDLIVKMWAKNNASIQGMEQFINHRNRYPKENFSELHDELKKRMLAGYNPIIYASFPSTPDIKFNIHVMQAIGVSDLNPANDSFDLFIWDDGVIKDVFGKFEPEKLIKVIRFSGDGRILWLESLDYMNMSMDQNDPLFQSMLEEKLIDDTLWIDLLPNDDRIMHQLVKNKLKWCKSKPEYHRYCN